LSARPVVRRLAARVRTNAAIRHRTFSVDGASDKPLFDKILVANRGEIACRVFRTAKRLGIKTVAVYSEADAQAVHVREADEAVCIGPAPSAQSYLQVPNILEAIRATGAQAVHPGYGFLSENAEFSQTLQDEGIEFIGPNANAIHAMGDKIMSMRLAQEAGVSTAPRFDGEVDTVEHALTIAKDIGYPIIMKASAGGGGKGMRVAWNEEELVEGFKLARDEAMASFGDNRMLIQHFVCPVGGHHIEIQLVGDKHGNVLTLPERECSIQRRNQKVIEEAPSVLLTPETRQKMQEQSASLAKAAGYHSAGTVEFLCDDDQNFYFLEMNTRLQVEHPVTELITGIDLVELMIKTSAGLPIDQHLLDTDWSQPRNFNGWAIESRVYAEDPTRDFLPSVGLLTRYIEPQTVGVRCDSGVADGSEISMYYDPMICKLCTHGEDRMEAVNRMTEALDHYVIEGLRHNVPLLYDILQSDTFKSGHLSTNYIADTYPDGFKSVLSEADSKALAAAMTICHDITRQESMTVEDGGILRGFEMPESFELTVSMKSISGTAEHTVVAKPDDFMGGLVVSVDGGEPALVSLEKHEMPIVSATVDDDLVHLQMLKQSGTSFTMQFRGTMFDVQVLNAEQKAALAYMPVIPEIDHSKVVVAPISGMLRSVAVQVGDEIGPGQEICVLEAMKMHNSIKAVAGGTVKAVHFGEMETVSADDFIVEFE